MYVCVCVCVFGQWCEQDSRCRRLQLTDLLISPMQRCTKVPMMLNSIRQHTQDAAERQLLADVLDKLEESLSKSFTKKLCCGRQAARYCVSVCS